MSTDNTLWKLREAILKNTCRPIKGEVEDLDMKSIRVSAIKEGDSQLGLILFIGVANELGYDFSEISVAESLEYDEIKFKIAKYKERMLSKKEEDERFVNKVKLVKNYLRLV